MEFQHTSKSFEEYFSRFILPDTFNNFDYNTVQNNIFAYFVNFVGLTEYSRFVRELQIELLNSITQNSNNGPNSIPPGSSPVVTFDYNHQHFHYNCEKIIGEGLNSIVYKGAFGSNPAAVKRVIRKHEDINAYENELNIWLNLQETRELGNVNLVTLLSWTSDQRVDEEFINYFVMELANCNLKEWISQDAVENQPEISESKILGFVNDTAKGLKYMHDRSIVHQDIKIQNILIFYVSGKEIAKLGGFGMSKKIHESSSELHCAKATDVFSLGMLAFNAFSFGSQPVKVDRTIKSVTFSYQLYSKNHLLEWMMQMDPQKRPNVNQVIIHPISWTLKKSLQFLVEVAQTFHDKNDTNLMKLRKKIDQQYLDRRNSLKQETSWKVRMDAKSLTLLLQRKSNRGEKEYNGQSVMCLVELIRDKQTHFQDLMPGLISDEYFGETGVFSEEKYIQYFLNVFPDLVIFLFCALAIEKSTLIYTLRKQYFSEFVEVPLIPRMKQ